MRLRRGRFRVVPRLSEVSIRGTKLVYVPKWDLAYEAGQTSFSRRFLASSGRSLEDGLAKCQKCTLLKKETVAVCEVCRGPLSATSTRIRKEGGCARTTSQTSCAETKGTGLFSRFKLGRS